MLLTITQLSNQLNVHPATLYAWARDGKIPCVHLRRLVRFDPDHIPNWLASKYSPKSLGASSSDSIS